MSTSSSRAWTFFEYQQGCGFGERLLFPSEFAFERPHSSHRRQRRPPFLAEGQSPLLVVRLEHVLAAKEIRQLGTRQGARLRQDPNLLLDRPIAPWALRRHDWKTTRLLHPPRKRLLPEARFQCQLPRTDRISAGQARHHLLSNGQRERLRHRIVAFSPR